jgi:tripartite-type tricarboxylate transporter receptor subunit TctC
MGASGPLTGFHIAFERLKQAASANLIFVPFGGTVPVVNALLGGHIVSAFGDYSLFAEHFKTGALHALATGQRTRTEALPEIPTVAESGFREYQADIWYGLVAPRKHKRKRSPNLPIG